MGSRWSGAAAVDRQAVRAEPPRVDTRIIIEPLKPQLVEYGMSCQQCQAALVGEWYATFRSRCCSRPAIAPVSDQPVGLARRMVLMEQFVCLAPEATIQRLSGGVEGAGMAIQMQAFPHTPPEEEESSWPAAARSTGRKGRRKGPTSRPQAGAQPGASKGKGV